MAGASSLLIAAQRDRPADRVVDSATSFAGGDPPCGTKKYAGPADPVRGATPAPEAALKNSAAATASEQHRGEPADLPEPDPPVRARLALVVVCAVDAWQPAQVVRERPDDRRHPWRGPALAAQVGVHPHPLDQGHSLGQRPDLCLEHHPVAVETRESAAAGDQVGDPGPVATAVVTDPRVHPDLFGEHGHRGREVHLELIRPHRPDVMVDRTERITRTGHQGLISPDIPTCSKRAATMQPAIGSTASTRDT